MYLSTPKDSVEGQVVSAIASDIFVDSSNRLQHQKQGIDVIVMWYRGRQGRPYHLSASRFSMKRLSAKLVPITKPVPQCKGTLVKARVIAVLPPPTHIHPTSHPSIHQRMSRQGDMLHPDRTLYSHMCQPSITTGVFGSACMSLTSGRIGGCRSNPQRFRMLHQHSSCTPP